jgi:hypothetical protein
MEFNKDKVIKINDNIREYNGLKFEIFEIEKPYPRHRSITEYYNTLFVSCTDPTGIINRTTVSEILIDSTDQQKEILIIKHIEVIYFSLKKKFDLSEVESPPNPNDFIL